MRLKKFVSTCVLGVLVASSVMCPAEADAKSNPNIVINNVMYSDANQPSPENINGRVYVPLRMISTGLGYNVDWDHSTRSVLINSTVSDIDDTSDIYSDVQIYINGEKLYVNPYLGVPYITPTGRTMVPIRVISEKLGADVTWVNETQSVVIKTAEVKPTPIIPPVNTSKPQSASEVTLLGQSYCTVDQMERYLANKENELRISKGANFVPFPNNIAQYYYNIGKKYNIRGDVALAQALLETGYFQYGNEVKPWQNNYCGLGAIGHATTQEELESQVFSKVNHDKAYLMLNIHGWCYDTVATGVEAHIQHMYSYASANNLPAGTELLDGRFAHGNRGKAIYLNDLNGKWAVPGHNYGEKIYENMLVPMMNS